MQHTCATTMDDDVLPPARGHVLLGLYSRGLAPELLLWVDIKTYLELEAFFWYIEIKPNRSTWPEIERGNNYLKNYDPSL
jgi:hypothetical protein